MTPTNIRSAKPIVRPLRVILGLASILLAAACLIDWDTRASLLKYYSRDEYAWVPAPGVILILVASGYILSVAITGHWSLRRAGTEAGTRARQ